MAHHPITDWEAYRNELNHRLGLDNQLFRVIGTKARRDPRKVVFAEADNLKVLKAAQVVNDEGIAYPILLGNEARIRELMLENAIEIDDVVIIDPKSEEMKEMRHRFGDLFFQKRQRKGLNLYEARKIMRERNYFGCMMVETGEADALISGLTRKYPDTIRPALQVIGMEEGAKRVAGMYIIQTKRGPLFLADTTVNFNPTAEELADITMMVAKEVKHFNMTPRIAMLSYSNFGSSQTPEAQTMSKAREIVKQRDPSLIVDGEIQAAMAFNKEILKDNYPFTELLEEEVNTLIFPNLAAGNIAYNLLQEVAGFDAIGPILLGMKKPVHILQLGSTVRQIVNMVNIAVVDAQEKCCREQKEEKGKKKKKK
uniref:phosphate acyltransferase n=1 Tax=Chitinophaga ginsengisegetis TaxID=393003 RepID=UPI0035B4FEFB